MSATSNARHPITVGKLTACGVAAFVLAALVAAPASLLAPALQSAGSPIRYERLDGTVWKGQIKNLWVQEHYFGNLQFRVSPMKLLFGRVEARVRAEGGAGTGVGRVGFGLLGRTLSVRDAAVVFDLSSVRGYTMFGIPYQGQVRASIDRLIISRNRCRIAEGEVWTDMLNAPAQQYLGDALPLSGVAACDGDNLALRLNGENASGTTQITVKVTPALSYEFVASVDPTGAELEDQLPLVGFEERGAQYVYDAYGELRGMGS